MTITIVNIIIDNSIEQTFVYKGGFEDVDRDKIVADLLDAGYSWETDFRPRIDDVFNSCKVFEWDTYTDFLTWNEGQVVYFAITQREI